MRQIYVFLLLLVSFPMFAQRVVADKNAIQSILDNNYDCKVTIGSVSTTLNPSVRTWGFDPKTYKPYSFRIYGRCISITYSVEKDTNGSSYSRELLIPVSLINVEYFKDDDMVYYEDTWTGDGPRFDTQGGAFKANEMIKIILSKIEYFANE